MSPAIWIMLAVCLVLGFGLSWVIGRYLSRALLRGVWLALVLIFAMLMWPVLQIWAGWREGTGFDGVAEFYLAVGFVLPTLLASGLGGRLGARAKAARRARDDS
ncbi:hypothetical protein [Nioella ostreopsis]|jgi:hypothetical protein|uniref:hypothetical protein n=1 Tax=Nioella ostreopsis TaxID=2448479 RepID=UPI000FD77425|nr:hypothetical protein [Nioella ostreopsis]